MIPVVRFLSFFFHAFLPLILFSLKFVKYSIHFEALYPSSAGQGRGCQVSIAEFRGEIRLPACTWAAHQHQRKTHTDFVSFDKGDKLSHIWTLNTTWYSYYSSLALSSSQVLKWPLTPSLVLIGLLQLLFTPRQSFLSYLFWEHQ